MNLLNLIDAQHIDAREEILFIEKGEESWRRERDVVVSKAEEGMKQDIEEWKITSEREKAAAGCDAASAAPPTLAASGLGDARPNYVNEILLLLSFPTILRSMREGHATRYS